MLLSGAKQLPVAAPVRGRRRPGDDGACRCRHDREHVLIAMRVDTNHVVQLVCKHQTRSSDHSS